MTPRRPSSDDGSPETPDLLPWEEDEARDGSVRAEPSGLEATDLGGMWIEDAARLRLPGEEEHDGEGAGVDAGEETSAAPEEPASAGRGGEDGEPAGGAPAEEGPETGGASPEEGGGGTEEPAGGEGPEEGGPAAVANPAGTPEFVAALVADPANPPEVMVLSGYLGASAEEGHTRLYHDAELRWWTDLPEGDVLHAARTGRHTLAETLVWVRADSSAFRAKQFG